MNLIIITSIIAISLGIGITFTYLLLRPQLETTQKLNEEIINQNKELEDKNRLALETKQWLEGETKRLQDENSKLSLQKELTTEQINTLNNSIKTIEQQAQEAADLFYSDKMKVAQEHFEQALEEESKKYQDSVNNFQIEYQEVVNNLLQRHKELEENIKLLQASNDAAVEAAKRAEEMADKQNYYRIQLSDADIKEIELLRQVEPYLRDKEALNKVIWKVYYEKPTNDLIGRVIGSGPHTGIYKITNIENQKCYVGQAVSLSDRWKQHIKRGVGADTPTRNKLYPAMREIGPENFTFEVIEECERSLLDSREKYWTDYFKAQEYGYSIRKG